MQVFASEKWIQILKITGVPIILPLTVHAIPFAKHGIKIFNQFSLFYPENLLRRENKRLP